MVKLSGRVMAAALTVLSWMAPAMAEGTASQPQGQAAQVAEMMDRNGDGIITEAEFLQHNARGSLFDQLDVNGDGVLTAEEQDVQVGPRRVRH